MIRVQVLTPKLDIRGLLQENIKIVTKRDHDHFFYIIYNSLLVYHTITPFDVREATEGAVRRINNE
jgi:hypothetical protein